MTLLITDSGGNNNVTEDFPIHPLNGNIVVAPFVAQTQTKGGVFLPEMSHMYENGTKRHRETTVLAVGPGTLLPDNTRLPMSVKPGDRVLVNAEGGVTYYREGEEFATIMPERAVVAVVDAS